MKPSVTLTLATQRQTHLRVLQNTVIEEILPLLFSAAWGRYRYKEWKKFQFTAEYSEWRLAVLARDGFHCVDCGSHKKLTTHHIFKKALYPHMGILVENGVTLCSACHDAIRYQEEERAEMYCAKIGSTVRPINLCGHWPGEVVFRRFCGEVA